MYMKALPESLEFDWDTGNLNKSYKKHGITQKEAEEIFVSEDFFVAPDVKHSQNEERLIGLGTTTQGEKLLVVFTRRKKKIRVISTRRMHRKEVEKYEKAQTDPTL